MLLIRPKLLLDFCTISSHAEAVELHTESHTLTVRYIFKWLIYHYQKTKNVDFISSFLTTVSPKWLYLIGPDMCIHSVSLIVVLPSYLSLTILQD